MEPVCVLGQRKSRWLTVVVWLVMGLTVALSVTQTQAGNDSFRAVIQQAGNADSDESRLDYLRKLRKQPGLDASFKEDLTKFITQIDRWLHEERLDYFGRQVSRRKDFDFQIPDSSPHYPLT